MIKKLVTLVALSVVLVNESAMITSNALESPNETVHYSITSTSNEHKPKCDCHEKHDIEMLCKESNKKLLSEDEKKALCEIEKCIKDEKELSQEQKKALYCMKEKIVKAKLGDKDYEKFKCLLKKEMDGEKLSNDEKTALNDYMKKLKD